MPSNRKLGKPTDQRMAMLRGLVTDLLNYGQLKTTVTLAKQNNLAAYRQALAFLTQEDVAKKLFDQIGPKYADRNGGYTRVVRIGPRRGDAAEMAIIQLV